jgi:nucleoside-diphosphate-sugar epimerase
MSRIFDHPADGTWDFVFNLGGNTAWSRTAEEYKLQSTQLSITLGKEAAKRGVKAFVEASTGIVYSSERKPQNEQAKLKPWLKLAKAKLEAEQELAKIPGLNLIILRFAHVYGPYASGFFGTLLCLARVFQEKQEELKWLWTEDLRTNTVHIDDAVRALWKAAEWRRINATIPASASSPTLTRRPTLSSKGEDPPSGNVPIFNIVDHAQTSQGKTAEVISKVFNIKTGFQGSVISQLAKLNLESVADDLNEDVLQPWADMLAAKEITKPGPLTAFLEKELLKDNDLSLDGALFEKVTGFEYQKPQGLTVEAVSEMLDSYRKMGWWP